MAASAAARAEERIRRASAPKEQEGPGGDAAVPPPAPTPAPAPVDRGGGAAEEDDADDADDVDDADWGDEDLEFMEWGHWQLERPQVEFAKKIGSGEFGEVSSGKLHGTGSHEGMVASVAIKTLIKGSQTEFLREARTMIELHHPNIVNIYGVVTVDAPMLVVLEMCEWGSLNHYLRTPAATKLGPADIVDLVGQVAEGMEYIEEEGFVHRDLAARNVLIEALEGTEVRAKVADFGLAARTRGGVYQGDVNKCAPLSAPARRPAADARQAGAHPVDRPRGDQMGPLLVQIGRVGVWHHSVRGHHLCEGALRGGQEQGGGRDGVPAGRAAPVPGQAPCSEGMPQGAARHDDAVLGSGARCSTLIRQNRRRNHAKGRRGVPVDHASALANR